MVYIKNALLAEDKAKAVAIAFKQDKHIFFLYGFAKNQQENIGDEQKEVYLELAKRFLTMTDQEINVWLNKKKLIEVVYED